MITTAVDSAIADKIKSIEDFRKNMAARFKEKMTDLTTKKNKEITTEKLGIALSQIDQTKVNVENHVEVVDAVTINYFKVPDYPKIDLWPKILEKLVEEYLTFYWTKVASKTEKRTMLTLTWRTFEEEMKHHARESVKIYRMKAMPKDDPRYLAVASFIKSSDWSGLLRYTNTLSREDMIAIGLNPEVKKLIEDSKMGHYEKAVARTLFFISK